MTHTKITAVLFDWDLTLARVLGDASFGEREMALFQHAGLPHTLDEIQTALHSYQIDVKGEPAGEVVKPQTRQGIIHYYRQILKQLGYKDPSWELGERLYRAYGRLPTTLYEDTLPTLQLLQQKGVSMGIISNHSISARQVMEQFVGEFIPPCHVIISEEIGVHKPAKTIFRRAAVRLRATPAHCLFVGDNLSADAAGAERRGGYATGLWLDREGDGDNGALPDCVHRITSLCQVLDFV